MATRATRLNTQNTSNFNKTHLNGLPESSTGTTQHEISKNFEINAKYLKNTLNFGISKLKRIPNDAKAAIDESTNDAVSKF